MKPFRVRLVHVPTDPLIQWELRSTDRDIYCAGFSKEERAREYCKLIGWEIVDG